MERTEAIAESVQKGKAAQVKELVAEALAGGLTPGQVLDAGLLAGMNEVSSKFRNNELYIPEVLIAARAMNAGLALLRPLLVAPGAAIRGRVVIGTVKGDLHDIGKNLVASMLEGGGFDVVDLGADVSPEKFIEAVQNGANVVCLSALLTVTMPSMKTTIDALCAAGVRDRVKILVGGAPVTPQYAREIGADGYGENAATAVALARQMVGVRT